MCEPDVAELPTSCAFVLVFKGSVVVIMVMMNVLALWHLLMNALCALHFGHLIYLTVYSAHRQR